VAGLSAERPLNLNQRQLMEGNRRSFGYSTQRLAVSVQLKQQLAQLATSN